MTLPRTGLGTTSLGAVGGPRGTAAGALRILVEFVSQYDPKAVKQLEADLQSLLQQENAFANQEVKIENQAAKQRVKIHEAEVLIKAKFTNRAAKQMLDQSRALRETGNATDKRQAAALLTAAIQRQGLTRREERVVRQLAGSRTRLLNLERQQNAAAQTRLALEEQRLGVEAALGRFKGLKTALPQKLAGLALGAVGGIVGGALLGVGFAAAEAALAGVGEALQDLLDPARHAREAIKEVGDEIESLRQANEGFTDQDAARQFLRNLGLDADDATVQILAQAGASVRHQKTIQAEIEIQKLKAHGDALEKENIKQKTDLLIAEAKARGDLVMIEERRGSVTGLSGARGASSTVDRAHYEAQAIDAMRIAEQRATEETERLAAAQERLAQQLAATASLARFAEAAIARIAQARAATLIAPIQNQIDTLGDSDPTSARTRGLEKRIEDLQNAEKGDGGRAKELANIAEERALILLRMRLRLLGTAINLEEYEGKFLLAAIDAKIKALDKQQRAQDRLNKALDLQFRASQKLRRQEGESIQDFQERQAQENREILTEQRALEQEVARERLQELQDKTQDEVALAELAERAKDTLAKSGSDNRIKLLQKELEASRKADATALRNKIEALEAQREEIEKAADQAAHYATELANEEIRQAYRAAKTIGDLVALSGEARGLIAAREFFKALLLSGALTSGEAANVQKVLDRINATLGQIGDKESAIFRNILVKPGQAARPFAAGGFIPLNAGSTPFGSNARFGEHGTEAGMMVFPTDVLNKMRGKGSGSFGDVIVHSSDNPLRDRYAFRREIRSLIKEELNA